MNDYNFVGCDDGIIAFLKFLSVIEMHIKMFTDDRIFLKFKKVLKTDLFWYIR